MIRAGQRDPQWLGTLVICRGARLLLKSRHALVNNGRDRISESELMLPLGLNSSVGYSPTVALELLLKRNHA
jgi:hypothetical protein